MLPEFPQATAYLDIETTGLRRGADVVTTIALYDGQRVQTFVGERTSPNSRPPSPLSAAGDLQRQVLRRPLSGTGFGIVLEQAHVDLRYVLHSLGFRGGLKGCERQLGIGRGELAGVDGFFAVLLWQEFCRSGDRQARETLLAYNVADTINLATLAAHAYNRKLATLPCTGPRLSLPEPPEVPFAVDHATVLTLRRRLCGW